MKELLKYILCHFCNGTGLKHTLHSIEKEPCNHCKGTGKLIEKGLAIEKQ